MPPPHAQKFERPQNVGRTFARILQYVGRYRPLLFAAFFAMLVNVGSQVAGTYMLKPLLNEYIVPLVGRQSPDLSGFARILTLLAGLYLAGALCAYAFNRIMMVVCTSVLRQVRVDMFTHMQSLPIRYFDQRTHGEIMSRYTNDTDTLREMISQSLPQLISSAIQVVSVFVMMLVLSWELTLLVLVMLLVMLSVIAKVGGGAGKYFVRQQRELGHVNGYIEELIEGQKVVKVFCHEPQSKAAFDERNAALCDAAKNAHTFANILMPIMGNLSHMHYALTAVLGALLAINGRLDIGTIGAFLPYTRSFSQPITQISQQFNTILTALAGAERIFRLIDEEPEPDEGTVTLVNVAVGEDGSLEETRERTAHWAWKTAGKDGTAQYVEVRGDVRMQDVTFGYVPEKTVLKNISLFAKPGQKIAFVGSTGAGKTTITNLLNRYYDIDSGTITYDGIPLRQIKKDDLRRSLGMVLQDTHLFTATVRENIRYGRLDATDEEVEAAAKLANAHFFITHLPQGYDTVLTADGANLSQGQRQLLAIARAAVADPPVLILDEATSSIDTRTEKLIERGMDRLMAGRTVFVIAHRLSTVRNANAILVLENGEIIERGDHEDLLEQKGRYYQLYTGAFELS